MTVAPGDEFTSYQKRLFAFLSVACFFEGYDFIALTQILPNLRADLGLSEATAGTMLTLINLGTVVAYLLIRLADRIGRKTVMTMTILGFTLFTFLTGFTDDKVTFTICQFLARVFLIAEWAISMVIAAEEFPAARRGMVIGVIQASTSLGGIVCAGLVPILLKTQWEWRAVYFSAVIPLVLIMYARRGLRETTRFQEVEVKRRPFHYILTTPYRKWVFRLAAIWSLTYIGTATAVTYWKEFAVGERGMTDGEVGMSITIAALVSMPLVFYSGRLLDIMGRKKGGAIIFVLGSLGILGSYTLHGRAELTVALVFGVFGVSAMMPVLNAFTTELFPTELRADAFAWSNNMLGRIGYIITPMVVGHFAGTYGYGPSVAMTTAFPILALLLIFILMPETRGRELEDTAAVPES
jgi:putative MFS transporter